MRIVLCYPVEDRHYGQICAAAPRAECVAATQDTIAREILEADIFCGHAKVPMPWPRVVQQGRLQWIQSSAAGLDHCLVPEVVESDIIVTGASGLFADAVAESKIPVIKHLHGVCHTYIDDQADIDKAVRVAFNAKTQRYGTCNTMETLLVADGIAPRVLPVLGKMYVDKGVELRGCERTRRILPDISVAQDSDWDEERIRAFVRIHRWDPGSSGPPYRPAGWYLEQMFGYVGEGTAVAIDGDLVALGLVTRGGRGSGGSVVVHRFDGTAWQEEQTIGWWHHDTFFPRPEAAVEQAEVRARYRQLVNRLPDDKRQVIQMVLEMEMSLRDTADALEIPEGTVKSRLYYARRQLARDWRELDTGS